ncbi:MAG: peptidylprolyl isomerase [Bacteroidetes bacterium]|nr:peptidylprolyl isomerase [Bacteroidota bacterium]
MNQKKNIKLFKTIIAITGVLLFFSCNKKVQNQSADEDTAEEQIIKVDTSLGLFAKINTSKGVMIARLFEEKAQMTVANFVALAEGTMPNTFRKPGTPFFDSLKFHRVISLTNGDKENFMIQGGDPLGTGQGGPGYLFKDEFSDLKLDRPGLLAMANSGPSTNGSQFFITLKATPWLDGVHTVFGELISGTEIPFIIKANDMIFSIRILRKGEKANKYNALNEFNKRK